MGIRNKRSDGGAALVEMALIFPLLLLMVLGIVELSYALSIQNEIRHGAHEGARLAAVDDASIITNTCDSMGLAQDVAVHFERAGSDIGDQGTVVITVTMNSLSGLSWIEVFVPDQLSETAQFKLEQPATWADPTDGTC